MAGCYNYFTIYFSRLVEPDQAGPLRGGIAMRVEERKGKYNKKKCTIRRSLCRKV